MKNIIIGLKMLLLMTIIAGLINTGLITLIAQGLFPTQANGNPDLMGQKFDLSKYFWSRPSAGNYAALPSAASNLSITSKILQTQVAQRRASLEAANTANGITSTKEAEIPSDLLYSSGSGLDPDISVQAALYQAGRVAKARNIEINTVLQCISEATQNRDWLIFGEERVNVLKLNRLLDQISSK